MNIISQWHSSNHSASKRLSRFKPTKLSRFDWSCILVCVTTACYLAIREPILFGILGCASVVFLSLWNILRMVPALERMIGRRIQFWHIVTLIMTATVLLSSFELPAQAVFLSGLQNFFGRLSTNSASNGAQAIPATTIALIFDLIRGVFLLLVAAAALFAYNQAQQGNDWRPIVAQVGIAFGVVLAIDVVTFLFVGNDAGGGGNNAPQNQGAFLAPQHSETVANQTDLYLPHTGLIAPVIDRTS